MNLRIMGNNQRLGAQAKGDVFGSILYLYGGLKLCPAVLRRGKHLYYNYLK